VINFSVEEEAGQSASEALAYALRTLAKEMAQDPSIRRFAAGGA